MNRIIFYFLLLTVCPVFSQEINKQKLDSLFDLLEKNNKSMGSVSISKNGQEVYSRSIGFSYFDPQKNRVASTNKTRYRIGSITKMFTAVLIFQLIEQKKISLQTRLSEFLPSIQNADQITIEQMLNHHSGIHSYTDTSALMDWSKTGKTKEELIAIISDFKPDFQPGEKGAYSNSNFLLLGYMLEKIYGKSYDKILLEKITKPLKLSVTAVGKKVNLSGNECYSYAFTDSLRQIPSADMSLPGAAGAIVSTPTEINKFMDDLFAGRLISNTSLEKMRSMKDGFGSGMYQFELNGKNGYEHGGGIDGFISIASYIPADRLSVSYFANYSAYFPKKIKEDILKILYHDPYQFPDFSNVSIPTEVLDKYTGVYASSKIPIEVKVFREGDQLNAQATGQSAFTLDSKSETVFTFDLAGIRMEFDANKKEMTLFQGGGTFLFTKLR